MANMSFAQNPWQSKLVKQDENGTLTYYPDKYGFVIPDFSQAGYKNGQEIPAVNIPDRTVIISPLPDEKADNTAHIQKAIDDVAAYAPDADGIRGVVLLKAGLYNVDGTINLSADGVILRGEGNCYTEPEASRSVIYGRNAAEKDKQLILMGSSSAHNWGNGSGSDKVNIVNDKVMPGDRSFQVTDASAYSPGDLICIKFPTTQSWLEAVMYGGNTKRDTEEKHRWKASNIDISYHRYVTKVDGNTIEVDAPVYYTLDKKYATSYIYKIPNPQNIRRNIGIENLHIAFEPTPSSSKVNAAQNCILMSSLENSWVKDVSMTGFIHAGIKITSTTRSTIEGCYSIDPSGLKDGGTWYNFETYHRSQLILLKNCYARGGRHHYISNGCATVSGIVVLNFRSEKSNAVSEGHRMFSQGILFDNWKEIDETVSGFKIGMYLRNNMGTGHGWGGVHSVFWNCDVQKGGIYLDEVPTAQNYAIGCTAGALRQYYNKTDTDYTYKAGEIEGRNKAGLQPASLYEAQRKANALSGITSSIADSTSPIIETDGNCVKISASAGSLISIYSTLGTLLQQFRATETYTSSRPLTSGLYIVIVNTPGHSPLTRKVIVDAN